MTFRLLAVVTSVVACDGGGASRIDAGDESPDGGGDSGTPDARAADAAPAGCDGELRFDLNDVSFLFPLPASDAEDAVVLRMDAAGARGPLLPGSLFDELPPLMHFFEEVEYTDLAVMAARVDPCFRDRAGDACRRQVRLVVQPLFPPRAEGQSRTAGDAAVHLFYDLSAADLEQVVAGLGELRAMAGGATTCAPLGVHPVMAAEGTTGPYASRLRQLLLTSAGQDNLVRVAVMELQVPGTIWRFSSLDVAGGELVARPVPRLGDAPSQSFAISDTGPVAELAPAPAGSGIPLLLDGKQIPGADEAALVAASRETHAIENPLRETVGSIDCLSCHLTHRALEHARSIRPFEPDDTDAYRRDDLDLRLQGDVDRIGSQRAFGYFDSTPSLTPRTIHETAEVAAALSAEAP